MPPKKAKTKKTQRGGSAVLMPHHYQMGNPYMNVQNGEGFFGDVWNGIKSVASKAGNFIKDQHLISKGLSMIPDARAQMAAQGAKQVGLGKGKRKNVLKF